MAEERKLDDASRIWTLLRAEREAQGLSQQWVADRLGVTKQTISDGELEKDPPGEELLARWLAALHLPASWADQWGVLRETERVRATLERRGLASDADIDFAVKLLRQIQRPKE